MAGISATARELCFRGWAERNAGNISVDVTGLVGSDHHGLDDIAIAGEERSYPYLAGRSLLITCTGSRMRDMIDHAEDNTCILRMDDRGDGYRMIRSPHADSRPASELASHLGIHQIMRARKTDMAAVLHTHPTELVALTHIPRFKDEAVLNRLLWSMHPETKVVVPEGVGMVPYNVPGSAELGEATVAAFENHRVVIWEKHGSVAVGRDLAEAFDLIDTMNKSARIFFLCKAAGYDPEGLTDEQVSRLERVFLGEGNTA